MTRTEKIERIKKYRPSLYMRLQRNVPDLVHDPNHATENDIFSYNNFITVEAKRDNTPEVFIKNFSFYSQETAT